MARSEIRGGQIKDDSITGDDVDESTLILNQIRDADGDTKVQVEESADGDAIRFDTAGTERMIITQAGAVGIGTSSPDNTLHVESPGTTHIKIASEAGYEAALKLKSGAEASAYVWQPGNSSDLRFYVNGADRMHIDNDGSVGVGTTGPDRKLDVLDASNPQLRLTHTDGSNYVDFKATVAGDLEVSPSNANGHVRFMSANAAAIIVQSNDAGDNDAQLGFSVNAGTSIAFSIGVDDSDSDSFKIGTSTIDTNTRMTISSAGNIGIGEDAPTSKLEINGSLATKVASKTADYTLSTADHTILIDANSANRTLTLPAVSTSIGRIYVIKRTDQGADTVTITRSGSDTIDGQATININGGDSITLQSTGNNSWIIIGEYRAPGP